MITRAEGFRGQYRREKQDLHLARTGLGWLGPLWHDVTAAYGSWKSIMN
jgi:hypothetical protein